MRAPEGRECHGERDNGHLGILAVLGDLGLKGFGILPQGVLDGLLAHFEVPVVVLALHTAAAFVAQEPCREALAVHLEAFALLALAALN